MKPVFPRFRVIWLFPLLLFAFELAFPVRAFNAGGQAGTTVPLTAAPDLTAYTIPGDRVKALVERSNSPSAVRARAELKARQARSVAEYESFTVVELSAKAARSAEFGDSVTIRPDFDVIFLNSVPVSTASPAAIALRDKIISGGGLRLIQFVGPIRDEWLVELRKTGIRLVSYIPSNAYLVYGDESAQRQIQKLAARTSFIQWDGAYEAAFKVHPLAYGFQTYKAENNGGNYFSAQLVYDPVANSATFERLQLLGGELVNQPTHVGDFENFHFRLPAEALAAFAGQPDLISIQPTNRPRLNDERQNMIVAGSLVGNQPARGDYLAKLAEWGFTQAQFDASGFIVDVTDSGADINPPGSSPVPQDTVAGPVRPNHFSFWRFGNRDESTGVSRFLYKGRFGNLDAFANGQPIDGHGHLNLGIVGGYVPTGIIGGRNFSAYPHVDASGFRYGMGVAPFVHLGNSVIFDPGYVYPNLLNMVSVNFANGARISSNSWGGGNSGIYSWEAQMYDGLVRDAQPTGASSPAPGNQEMTILIAAGNSGPRYRRHSDLASGKNTISVGATENVHPFSGLDGCQTGDDEADNADEMAIFSGRGPCEDGRFKPDIVAPGTHITGPAPVAVEAYGYENGTDQPGFIGDGICGGVAVNNRPNPYFPIGQKWYATSSGTSHSTPAVSGGAALVYQQFINNPGYLGNSRTPAGSHPPSPALLKAYLLNSTRFLPQVTPIDSLPSIHQGMGAMNLGTAFDGVPRIIRDQVPEDTFSTSGEVRVFSGVIPDGSKPFRVTLAWTDAPGSTTGNAYVNDLDLEVVIGGVRYRGNVLDATSSLTGGAADTKNNVESVILPGGFPAGTPFVIRVRASNIAGDGVTGNEDDSDQDFALVAYNGAPSSGGAFLWADAPVVAEVSGNANGVLEPCETANLTIPLLNDGTPATNTTATLSTSVAGVTVLAANSGYPSISAGGPVNNATPFSVRVDRSIFCGKVIPFTLTLVMDGGTVVLNIPLRVGADLNSANYSFSQSTGAIPGNPESAPLVPGTNSQGWFASLPAPFDFEIYGKTIPAGTVIRAEWTGFIQFPEVNPNYVNAIRPLPSTRFFPDTPVLFPFWSPAIETAGPGGGLFMQVIGSAPNRSWVLEWRGNLRNQPTSPVSLNFAVVFQERSSRITYLYPKTGTGFESLGAGGVIGIQGANFGNRFTQFSYLAPVLTDGTRLDLVYPVCRSCETECVYRLIPDSANFGASAGQGTIQVDVSSGCQWSAKAESPWIRIFGPVSGVGNGTVNFEFDANPGATRTGTVMIEGQRFSVIQAGGCGFSLSSISASVPSQGMRGEVNITAEPSCAWTATTPAPWVYLYSGAAGAGNGTLGFSVAPNVGPSRSVVITVAGQSFTVEQADGCMPAFFEGETVVGAEGKTGTASFFFGSGACGWNAESSAPWITVTSTSSGTGDGSFTYSVAPNPGGERVGEIRVSNGAFRVRQLCVNSFPGPQMTFSGKGGNRVIPITGNAGCGWASSSTVPWIAVTDSPGENGTGTVALSVQPNPDRGPGAIRFGIITVAGQQLVIRQMPGKRASTIGQFRVSNGFFYLRDSNTTGFADREFFYGINGDIPLSGDWDGDGVDTPGVYRNGVFYLRNSNSTGFAEIQTPFGITGDIPIVGDWNGDGIDTLGIVRGNQVFLSDSFFPATVSAAFFYGVPGDTFIAGDWDGDGVDTIGCFRPSNGFVFLRNSNSTGFADLEFFYGIAGDKPIVGDWNGDGIDTLGVVRGNQFLLRNSNSLGFADIDFFYGTPADIPVAGNWDTTP